MQELRSVSRHAICWAKGQCGIRTMQARCRTHQSINALVPEPGRPYCFDVVPRGWLCPIASCLDLR